MSQPPPSAPLVATPVGSVMVVRLTRPLILSGETTEAVAHHLERLADAGYVRILLDCSNARSLTSNMLSKLVGLNRKTSAAGGVLALCDVRPDVREILDIVGLPEILRVYATEQDARDSLGG